MLDLVVPADRLVLIEAWERVGREGLSEAVAHLSNSPERSVVVRFFDVRAAHDVFVGVVTGAGEGDLVVSLPVSSNLPSRLIHVKKDENGNILQIGESATEILGWANVQMVGHRGTEFIHPDDLDRAIGTWFEMLGDPGATSRCRYRHSRADGSWNWVDVTNHNVLDQDDACVAVEMIDIADEMAAVEALRTHEHLLERVAEALPIGLMQIESDGHISYANHRLAEILCAPMTTNLRDQLVTLTEDDRRKFNEQFDAVLKGTDGEIETAIRSNDGKRRSCYFTFRSLRSEGLDSERATNAAILTATDITDRRVAEEAAEREYRQLEEAQRVAHLGSFEQDPATGMLEISHELSRLLGIGPTGPIPVARLMQIVHIDDRHRLGAAVEACLTAHIPVDVVHRLVRADGTLRWVHARAEWTTAVHDGRDRILGTVLDITDVKRAEHALEYESAHDSLTGLANRASFVHQVASALQRAEHRAGRIAVVLLDLDDFKTVNDSLGHPVGDELLLAVSHRVASLARVEDTIARFGGDEFALLIESGASRRAAEGLAERIAEALRSPFVVDDHQVSVTASVGVALSNPSEDSSALLRDADLAMYLAKRNGKNRFEVARSGMQEEALERLIALADLHRALEHDEFEVHYQPIVDTHAGALTGAEALIRWRHPSRGLVRPIQFIDLAEASGLIVPIGRWVRREACRQAVAWRRAGVVDEGFYVSVNLSPRQLADPTLLDNVVRDLKESSLPASALVLEVTEGTLVSDFEAVRTCLKALKALGLRLALDDYGTGYSSLSRLADLPVDIVKIDKSFIDRLPSSKEGRALVKSVIDVSRTLGMTTVAEGVESNDQRAALDEMGCTYIQGYLFAKPVPAVDAEALFSKLRVRPIADGERHQE